MQEIINLTETQPISKRTTPKNKRTKIVNVEFQVS